MYGYDSSDRDNQWTWLVCSECGREFRIGRRRTAARDRIVEIEDLPGGSFLFDRCRQCSKKIGVRTY